MKSSDVDTHIDAGRLDPTILAHPDGPRLRFVESYSGIRGHFGDQDALSPEAKVIALAYGYSYAANVIERWQDVGVVRSTLTFVVGRDPRPTGAILTGLQRLGFSLAGEDLDVGVELRNLGVVTTPLIQAAVRACGADGGVISTGSHNPIEDNGLKYLTGCVEPEENSTNDHGAVLNGRKMGAVIRGARALLQRIVDGDNRLIERANGTTDTSTGAAHGQAEYRDWVRDVFRVTAEDVADIRAANARCGRRVVVDANGGGGVRIIPEVLQEFVDVVAINTEPGSFPHRIEPVDDALDDAIAAVEKCGAEFAVVFDADADRGNLVLRAADGRARKLPPQDVAMLNVAAMLAWVTAHADRYPELEAGKLAVVAHGATSSRVADVARRFGAELVEVETGEVNVVARMRELSRAGYFVPVGVEGSNGGTVFHGAVVRDGTLTALMALLAIADARVAAELRRRFPSSGATGEADEHATRLIDVLDSLPAYHSIQANLAAAAAGASQADVKREFEDRLLERVSQGAGGAVPPALELLTSADRVFLNYEETRVLEGRGHRQSQTGGFKLRFTDTEGDRHFFWFRVSKTEPGLARVVADSPREAIARELFDFGRELYQGAVASAARQELFASDRPVLLTASDRDPPRDLNCHELPRGLEVLVAGDRDLAHLHAGNLIAALAAHGNTVRWAASLDPSPSKSVRPDLVIAADGDARIESDLEALAAAAGRSVDTLYFPTLAGRTINLAVGGDEPDLEAVRQGAREHVSQVARTDYVAVLEWESRMAVAHASLAQLWPDERPRAAANVFLVETIGQDGETRAPQPRDAFQIVASGAPASAGFEPLHIDAGHHVLVLSPHPDDAEIAAGMFLRAALRMGATVHNVVHSAGHNGVTNEYPCSNALAQAGPLGVSAIERVAAWAGIDTDAVHENPRLLKEAVRLIEVEAAAVALAAGLPPNSGSLHVQQLALDHPGDADQRGGVSDSYETVLRRHLATSDRAPWIVVLPHPQDAHPTHRATTARALDVLEALAVGRAEIRLVYYRAPWSGTCNTYFLATANDRPASTADLRGELCLAVEAGKQALAILVGELTARRFGLTAPSPEKMGGAFAEEFRRALVQPREP